jgi:hypothetical protein
MRKFYSYFVTLVIVITFFNCSGPTSETVTVNAIGAYSEIEKINWLVGSWHNTSPEVSSTEVWEKKNDSTLAGISFAIVGKDTVSYETVSLEQNGKATYYIPTVKEQNNAQPVKFTLTSSTGNKIVFENPSHDFPTKITYNKITNDSMVAEISGVIEGKTRSEQFPFVRKK